MSDVTEVPLAPEVFWGCVAALFLGLFSWVVYKAMPRSEASTLPFRDIQGKLGLSAVPAAAFWIGALLWLGLLLILVAGLYAAIWDMLWRSKEFFEAEDGGAQFRFLATRLAGTTAVLGVVVAFPVTLNRLKLSREQNETAREALFNQKITEAAADLHAQRQVTLSETYKEPEGDAPRKRFNGWEDDVVRRNAAIDRLEGLVREQPEREIAERVARILSMYVRELSRQNPANEAPETKEALELDEWVRDLPALRSDIEAAVATLSRLAETINLPTCELTYDLRRSNLQRGRLSALDLRGADFSGANLEGAFLSGADLRSVTLRGAKLQGAQLHEARLDGAYLESASLQCAILDDASLSGCDLTDADFLGASLGQANMFGADLSLATFEEAELNMADMRRTNLSPTDFTDAEMMGTRFEQADFNETKLSLGTQLLQNSFFGAALRNTDPQTTEILRENWQHFFGDGSVPVPSEERPDHWSEETFSDSEFLTRWRAWQRSIGQDPGKPE